VSTNPLVATPTQASPDAWAGVWIAEDIELIAHGVKTGNWVDGAIGGVSAGLDALAFISDPIGALLQYGIAWIIEHVKPLSEALDWLAGNPAQIAAHAHTWRNVAAFLHDSSTDLASAARGDIADWGGTAGPAYQTWAQQQHQAITALAKAADTMATITEAAGMLIAGVRLLVRDAIATLVSRLIVYAVEELASLGLATPLVIEQVSTLCAAWAAKITHWLKGLITSIRDLMRNIPRLGHYIDKLKEILNRLRGASGTTGGNGGKGRRDTNPVDERERNEVPDGVAAPQSQSFDGYRGVLDQGAILEKHRNSEIYRRPGDADTAARDFDRITAGQEVRKYPNGTSAVTLADGTVVTLRASSDGRTTIELFRRDPRAQIKYRYGGE
jgi:uncharacterized protein YukE